jgi:hypothetical protein
MLTTKLQASSKLMLLKANENIREVGWEYGAAVPIYFKMSDEAVFLLFGRRSAQHAMAGTAS